MTFQIQYVFSKLTSPTFSCGLSKDRSCSRNSESVLDDGGDVQRTLHSFATRKDSVSITSEVSVSRCTSEGLPLLIKGWSKGTTASVSFPYFPVFESQNNTMVYFL